MAFEARILPHVSNSASKLNYLDQQLEGEPKDLISGCMFMTPDSGYDEARRLLNQEYGDPYKVSTAYITKAISWSVVRHDDSHGLKKLSYFLTRCYNAMQSISLVLQAILPVKVQQGDKGTMIDTYALYDNGSSGCFITESLTDQLNAKSTETTLRLQTMHGRDYVETSVVKDLRVTALRHENAVDLPKVYTRQEIPVSHNQIPKEEMFQYCPHLKSIATKMYPYFPHLEIGLLIGSNCPRAMQPLQVIPTDGTGPFAVLYRHGWTINGPVELKYDMEDRSVACNRIMFQEVESFKECIQPKAIIQVFELDFNERDVGNVPGEKGLSQEDQRFLDMAEEGCRMVEGHYQLPLPFRDVNVKLPNNRVQAVSRAVWQKKKMLRDEDYYKDYVAFVNKLIAKGYACKVPEEEVEPASGKVWYLPHHGVYHPKKKKIRVVFDCSAKYQGYSLNDRLLQGPDLTNSLVGVLTRFRQDPIAFMADIEAMFYQVKVPPHQHDYLRFLWWPDGNLQEELSEYCMSVHIFGAVSSPSVSNYALRSAADKVDVTSTEAANSIRRNFYVDDCLKSVGSEESAIDLITKISAGCAEGGFHLTKFICNNKTVLASIPKSEATQTARDLDLDINNTISERALGTQWRINSDKFGFSIKVEDKPLTRRGLLSVVSSVYDPLGFVAPFVLKAKMLIQELCQEGWDDEITDDHKQQWFNWKSQLHDIENVQVDRCLKPCDFGECISSQIHVFSDASTVGYGAVAYIRLCNREGMIHTAFLWGKARLAPLKTLSIPRLKLTAATVSVSIGRFLLKELDISIDQVYYHTDSTTVLHYIRNQKKRFPVFVTNRVKLIRDFTEESQWRYVESRNNPADLASRGMEGPQLVNENVWLKGPDFLQQREEAWPDQPKLTKQEDEDEGCAATSIDDSCDSVIALISRYSDWYKLKQSVAILRRVIYVVQARRSKESMEYVKGALTVQELEKAELAIIRFVQMQLFHKEINVLQGKSSTNAGNQRGRVATTEKNLPKASSIYRLDPFWDGEDNVLRVGGRLSKASISDSSKYPILLPSKSHVTKLIIRQMHVKLGHAGRNHVLSVLREKYWIINASSTVRNLITHCVTCKKIRGPVMEQKMADLPTDRVTPAPVFTNCGVDYFGPFYVKEGRKLLKSYGVLFTCLASRAVHVETANSLETDSFIQALRRFVARRGSVRKLRSDNGTNFVGAERELKAAILEMDQDQIQSYLLKGNIEWIFNPPSASHMGGVWERQIRTVRKVLAGLLKDHGDSLHDESFRTLMTEVEGIINSRPLTTISDSPDDLSPLTPNDIINVNKGVVVPPPGVFQHGDIYCRKQWRRVQYLSNLFWSRWKKEFLLTLQERQKWCSSKRNLKAGDIVLLKDDNMARNEWAMGRVTDTEVDKKGFVRSVIVKTQSSEFRRPVNKTVLLVANEE